MIVNYRLFVIRWVLALLVFWLALFFIMLGQGIFGLVALLFGGWCVYQFKDSRAQVRHSAHFARKDELDSLTRNVFEGDGVLVGYAYKKPLVVRPGTAGKKELGHFLWVGPSRSGKGLSIASNLYHWQGSAIVVDIKGEIAAQTAGYRRDVLGQDVYIINPSSGERSHQFDPFKELETDEQIISAALAFMNPDKDGANAIFALRASSALAAIIKGAKVSATPVVPFLDEMLYHPDGLKGTALRLQKLGDEQVTKWLNSFLGKNPDKMDWDEAAGDRFLNNSWQRLKTEASYLTTAGVKYMTGGSDFTAADIMEKPTSVYLVFRESELTLNLALFNLVIDAIFRSIMRRYDLDPTLKGQKILAMFDEAFRAVPNMLPEYTATVAGRGIYMAIYVQSIAQISNIWGKDGRTAIMENVHTKIFLPAVDRSDSDSEGTSAFVSASCGKYMIEDRGLAKEEHGKELNSNVRLTEKDLMTASDFAMLGVGKSIILCNDLPPILAYRLEPWRFKAAAVASEYPVLRPVERPRKQPLVTVDPATEHALSTVPTSPSAPPSRVLDPKAESSPLPISLSLHGEEEGGAASPSASAGQPATAVVMASTQPVAAHHPSSNATQRPPPVPTVETVEVPSSRPLELEPETEEETDIDSAIF